MDRLLTPVFLGFPGVSDGKESTHNAGDLGWIPGLRRSPEGGHGNPLQYYCLENPQGQRNLASYSPWSRKELDMTQQLSIHSVILEGELEILGKLFCFSKCHTSSYKNIK